MHAIGSTQWVHTTRSHRVSLVSQAAGDVGAAGGAGPHGRATPQRLARALAGGGRHRAPRLPPQSPVPRHRPAQAGAVRDGRVREFVAAGKARSKQPSSQRRSSFCRAAAISDYVRPACLHTDSDGDPTGLNAIATGWGATGPSKAYAAEKNGLSLIIDVS